MERIFITRLLAKFKGQFNLETSFIRKLFIALEIDIELHKKSENNEFYMDGYFFENGTTVFFKENEWELFVPEESFEGKYVDKKCLFGLIMRNCGIVSDLGFKCEISWFCRKDDIDILSDFCNLMECFWEEDDEDWSSQCRSSFTKSDYDCNKYLNDNHVKSDD